MLRLVVGGFPGREERVGSVREGSYEKRKESSGRMQVPLHRKVYGAVLTLHGHGSSRRRRRPVRASARELVLSVPGQYHGTIVWSLPPSGLVEGRGAQIR